MRSFLPALLDGRGRELVQPGDERPGFMRRLLSGRSWSTPGQPYLVNWDVERMVQDGYERVIWVWRGVDAIARREADLTIRAVPRDDLDKDDKSFVDDPLLHLLNVRANPHEPAWNFRYRVSSLKILSKKGVFIEVLRGRDGRPSALSILPVDRTNPVPADTEDPEWSGQAIDGFETWTANGERVLLPEYRLEDDAANSVLWVRTPHPTDPLSGTTPLEAAGISIDLDFWARLYNRNFMATDGRPGGVLAVQGQLDEAVAEELRSRFSGGPQAAGRTTVLEAQEISWVDTSTSPRDAQYVESRSLTKSDILEALGTPQTIIGNASDRTYDNANAERAVFWEETELPHCGSLARAYDVLTRGGDEDDVALWHDTSKVGPLQYVKSLRKKELLDELNAGGISIDEYRQSTGKEAFDVAATRVVWIAKDKIGVGDAADQEEVANLRSAGNGEEKDPVEQARQMQELSQEGAAQTAAQQREDERLRIADPVLPSIPGTPGPDSPPAEEKALPDFSAGVMVAMRVRPANAAALHLALPAMPPSVDLLPTDDYHVTLAWLGRLGEQFLPEHLPTLAAVVEQTAQEWGPIEATVSGLTSWAAGTQDSVVALVDAPGLTAMREQLVSRLAAAGVAQVSEHGFTAHMTVGYAPLGFHAPAAPALRGARLGLSSLLVEVGERSAVLPLQGKPGRRLSLSEQKVLGSLPVPQRHGGWIWQGAPGGDGPSLAGRRFRTASEQLTERQMLRFAEADHGDAELEALARRVGADDMLDPVDLNRLSNWFRGQGVERTADYLERQAREGNEALEQTARRGRLSQDDLDGALPHERSGVLEVIPGGYGYGGRHLRRDDSGQWRVLPPSSVDPFTEEVDWQQAQPVGLGSLQEAQAWVDENPVPGSADHTRRLLEDGGIDSFTPEPSTYEAAFPEVRFRERGGAGDDDDEPTGVPATRAAVLAEADELGLADDLAEAVRGRTEATLDERVAAAWESMQHRRAVRRPDALHARLAPEFDGVQSTLQMHLQMTDAEPEVRRVAVDELVGTQPWSWTEAPRVLQHARGEVEGGGAPQVVETEAGTLLLLDGHHRAQAAGPGGHLDAEVYRVTDQEMRDLGIERLRVERTRREETLGTEGKVLDGPGDFGRTVMDHFDAQQLANGGWALTVPSDAGDAVELALTDLFDRQQRTVVARMTGAKARRGTRHWEPAGEKALNPRYLLDVERWQRSVRESVTEPLRRTFRRGVAAVVEKYGRPSEPPQITAVEEDAYVAPLVERVVALLTARFERVVEEVERLESEGASIEEMRLAVEDAYAARDRWARSAAEEAGLAAYNAGALQGALRAGLELQKGWLSRRDDDVRDTHRDADGQLQELTSPFGVGDSALMTPGDPSADIGEWAGCRCVMFFVPKRTGGA